MSPETRTFLETVRRAEDPAPGDESRVLASLEAVLALNPGTAAAGSAPLAKGVLSGTGAALKVLATLLGIGAGGALVASTLAPVPGQRPLAPASQQAPAATPTVASSAPPALRAPQAAASAPESAPTAAPRLRHDAARSASVRAEVALLSDVQAALERGDGGGALQRLDAHVTTDRQFVAERSAARIAALCLLGRAAEARQAVGVFLRKHPNSVQRTAVESSCGATKIDGER
jgi:hypothetical protein